MKPGRELLYFSIVTFFVVLCWILFDVYHAVTTETVTPVQKKVMEPLTGQFDHEIILKVLERQEPR